MAPISHLIVKDGTVEFKDGILVKLPFELRSPVQFAFYEARRTEGWSTCPQGFHIYTTYDDFGIRYVFPGLIISGEKNSKKTFYGKKLELTKEQVLDLVSSVVGERKRLEKLKNEEISSMIHDLRGVSSAIYNSAEQAKKQFDDSDEGKGY